MKIKKSAILINKFKNEELKNEILMNVEIVKKTIKQLTYPEDSDIFSINTSPTKDQKGKLIKKHQNGVKPIKKQFRDLLLKHPNWVAEKTTNTKKYIYHKLGKDLDEFRGWGPLDFSIQLKNSISKASSWGPLSNEIRSDMVVEWETGNISSSHRSMNKMISAMFFSHVRAGILIVPVREFYDYLTDRTGNFKELLPYIPFWRIQQENPKIQDTYLEIIGITYDKIDNSVPFIPKGSDGRANV